MDRRMYRGGNRNVSPYRANTPVCGEVGGRYEPENVCGRREPEDMCGRYEPECVCGKGDNLEFSQFPLAMCYVPWQCFRDLYENEFVALKNGTIFKELDLEWYGRSCK